MPQATEDRGAAAPAPYYEQGGTRARIRGYVLSEMLRGAGIAALVVLTIGVGLWVIWLLGLFLPPESKLAPPPMPFSAVQTVTLSDRV